MNVDCSEDCVYFDNTHLGVHNTQQISEQIYKGQDAKVYIKLKAFWFLPLLMGSSLSLPKS